jgi:hypothetical protein
MPELDCRKIHGNIHQRYACIVPLLQLHDGLPQHPLAYFVDISRILRNPDKFIRRHPAELRVMPAQESLYPNDAAVMQ